jgi:hypothetical protein
MPQINYQIPDFSDYVIATGITGFEIAPKGPEDAFIAIKDASGNRVAELSLAPNAVDHVTISDRSAQAAIYAIAERYEGKFPGRVIRIRATYQEIES